jgi:hypothetical protein
MANLICPKCGANFDSDKLRVYRCKDCRAWLDWDSTEVVQKFEPEYVQVDTMANLDDSTKALVLAANRTTHAVRSLAVFLFTTLCSSLFGYGLVGAGASAAVNCNSYSGCGSEALVIWGWIIISVGFIVGLIVGIAELNKSRP